MSGRVSVTMTREVMQAVEALAAQERRSLSQTVALLVEEGMRARAGGKRAADVRGFVERVQAAMDKAQREADARSDERSHYCEGQAAAWREALRMLRGES
jgi:hypothetical protein